MEFIISSLFLLFAISQCSLLPLVDGFIQVQPQQVHLSFSKNPNEVIVTWVTLMKTNRSIVKYGLKHPDQVVRGAGKEFFDSGLAHRSIFIHRAALTGLKPKKTYYYRCGSPAGWSAVYHFTAIQSDTKWTPNLAVFGNLGNQNAQSLSRLQKEAQFGLYDAILHLGDFAFDLSSNDGLTGDEFFRQVEPIAAYVPYMTCVGNHEIAYNFSNYKNRFTMPNNDGKTNNNLFYSWNIGSAHIISFSTEFYFAVEFGWRQIVEQFNWLEKDLKVANQDENRSKRSWIITMGHRPMYCSNNNSDDCTKQNGIIRTGLPQLQDYGLEKLFYKYGVDLQLWAHENSYERLWPVFNMTVQNGSDEAPYNNPKAPVHVITGAAGSVCKRSGFKTKNNDWSAFRSEDYGFTRLFVINATHLFWEQISNDKNGRILDRVMMRKDNYRPAWMNE
uniref:Purple acid phosphatase n=1 Tax=Strigamia maritima TaxID=126957 RepID=T1IRD3_STRMM